MWIDRLVELKRGERLVAIKNVSLAEDHMHDHLPADDAAGLDGLPIMPASLILEGMAQTGGILIGHANDFQEKVILAKIQKAEIRRDVGPGMTLRYTAEVRRLDDMGGMTKGTIDLLDHANADGEWERIGEVNLLFSHLDQNMGAGGQRGVSFPDHNFVFGEGFKTLLRTSGHVLPAEIC